MLSVMRALFIVLLGLVHFWFFVLAQQRRPGHAPRGG